MADWPAALVGGARTARLSAVAAATSLGGTNLTASASQNTKGAWAEVIAATAEAYNQLAVVSSVASAFTQLVDIGVGAAGSENVLVANLLFARANSTNALSGFQYVLPVPIPVGTRISARNQCNGTNSGTLRLQVLASNGGFLPHAGGVIHTFGATAADSGGTGVDPGAVANTKGAWVELTSATARRIKGIMLAFGQQTLATRTATCEWLVDVGVGAAGSEIVVLADYGMHAFADAFTTPQPATSPLIPMDLPAGSRIAMRAQASVTTAGQRVLDAAIYGVA